MIAHHQHKEESSGGKEMLMATVKDALEILGYGRMKEQIQRSLVRHRNRHRLQK
jgi:hypothetical protein